MKNKPLSLKGGFKNPDLIDDINELRDYVRYTIDICNSQKDQITDLKISYERLLYCHSQIKRNIIEELDSLESKILEQSN